MIRPLKPQLMPYAWGSTTAIPALLGFAPTGEPVAEAWFGAHPSHPSSVEVEPGAWRPLDTYLDAELPYLVKLLAAAEPLSIQAHPSTEQAAAGFARENAAGIGLGDASRTYRDPHAKPEALLALEPFELLYGLRDPGATAALIGALAVPHLGWVSSRLRGSPGASGAAELWREVITGMCALDPADRAATIVELATACESRPVAGYEDTCRWVAKLGRRFPSDIGVLLAFVMNYARLDRFETVFLPAQTLHAYLGGTGVEVMGNSDNVVRAGLTPKFIAVDELLGILDFSPREPDIVRPQAELGGDGSSHEVRYRVPTEAFALHLITITPDDGLELGGDGPEILVVLDGEVTITAAGQTTIVARRGHAFFVDAATTRYRLSGAGQIARATVGDPTL